MTEFAWTIEDVLDQPEELLDAVMYLKVIGEKMRKQAGDQESAGPAAPVE